MDNAKRDNSEINAQFQKTTSKLIQMTHSGIDPKIVTDQALAEVKSIISDITPAEMAKFRFPAGKLVSIERLPKKILNESLRKHTMDELRKGQFIKVKDRKTQYHFVMDKSTLEKHSMT